MRALWGAIIILVQVCSSAWAEPPLIINTNGGIPYTTADFKGSDDLIVKEALRRIGREVKFIILPSARALANANQGLDDGNYPRIAGLTNTYPNLVRVPEMIRHSLFVAFAKKPEIRIRTWADLKPYRVGLITGWKIFETKTPKEARISKVGNAEQLFRMLAAERIDVGLYERFKGLGTIEKLGLKGIRGLAPPLAVKEMFLYLHKRHRALVPKLAAALKGMKADGIHWELIESTLGRFLK